MNPSEEKKKKWDAKKSLLAFLKRMRSACSTYGTVEEWYEEIKKLKSVLERFTDVLPSQSLAAVNRATELTDLTKSGVTHACKVLKTDLKKLIRTLPGFSGMSALVVKGVTGLAILAGGAAIIWHANKVNLTITNDGCSPIPVIRDLPKEFQRLLDVLGADLPLWIATNGSEVIELPPITLTMTSTGNRFSIELFGKSVTATLPANIISITANGRELLNTTTQLSLREAKRHQVVVKCQTP